MDKKRQRLASTRGAVETFARRYCRNYKIPACLIEDVVSEAVLAAIAWDFDKREIRNAIKRYLYNEKQYDEKQRIYDFSRE